MLHIHVYHNINCYDNYVKLKTTSFIISAGIDYTPEKIFLQFFPSSTGDTQWKCGEFSIVQDGLDEPEENFTLHLKQDNGNQILDSKTISINACKNNSKLSLNMVICMLLFLLLKSPITQILAILLRPLKEEHSIVEVCTNEEVWSTLCDHHWTELDARVACRQAGYNDTEKGEAIYNFVRPSLPPSFSPWFLTWLMQKPNIVKLTFNTYKPHL